MSLKGRITTSTRLDDLAEYLAQDGESVAELLNELGKRLAADPDQARSFKVDFRMCLAEHGRFTMKLMAGGR